MAAPAVVAILVFAVTALAMVAVAAFMQWWQQCSGGLGAVVFTVAAVLGWWRSVQGGVPCSVGSPSCGAVHPVAVLAMVFMVVHGVAGLVFMPAHVCFLHVVHGGGGVLTCGSRGRLLASPSGGSSRHVSFVFGAALEVLSWSGGGEVW